MISKVITSKVFPSINIRESLGLNVLTRERIWKFERKARNYMNLYFKISKKEEKALTFKEIETLRKQEKTYRTHRSVVHTDLAFLREIQSEDKTK